MTNNNLYVKYVSYKGINDLCVVSDDRGRTATSTKDVQTAIKNFNKRFKTKY